MSILLWLVIVNVAVFVHELAHYTAARMQGVTVRAFSIGMGPILWRRSWRGTEWRVSALPIGGYVDIEGMGATPGPDGQMIEPTTGMAKLPYLGKVWVLFAGPLSNLILAIVLVAGVLAVQGKPLEPANDRAYLARVVSGSPAEREGFRTGDVIVAINGVKINKYEELRASLQQDGVRSYTLERTVNGKMERTEKRFDWTPFTPRGGERPKFGVGIGPEPRYAPIGVLEAVGTASTELIGGIPATVQAFVKGVFSTFTFSGSSDVSGPVGATEAVGNAAQQGFGVLVYLAGIINLSLGVFNLLPIPGLDGGRILLSTIVAIRRKPFAPGQEEFINFLGFAFVLVFIGLVTFRDFTRLGG
jgi:regulator of sigma E protease